MTDRTHPDSGRATGTAHIIRYALELGLLWVDGGGRGKVREALDALDALEAQLEAVAARSSAERRCVMRCPCYECECEHAEPPEPEERDVRFKGHDINVSKDSLSANWYIRVIHPNGSKLYDGWWRDSATATWKEAIEEAKRGAMLNRPNEHPHE